MSAIDVVRQFLAASDRQGQEALLDDSLQWTVIGNGPLCRTYQGKSGFIDELMGQVGPRFLTGSHKVTVRAAFEDAAAETAIFEIVEDADLIDGGAYHNEVAAFFRVREGKIIEAREYMDLRPVDKLVQTSI